MKEYEEIDNVLEAMFVLHGNLKLQKFETETNNIIKQLNEILIKQFGCPTKVVYNEWSYYFFVCKVKDDPTKSKEIFTYLSEENKISEENILYCFDRDKLIW